VTNKSDIAMMMAYFKGAYQNAFKDSTIEELDFTTTVWAEILGRYSPEELKVAAQRWVAKSKWPPNAPSEIIEELETMRNPELQSRAEEEWQRILDTSYGQYGEISDLAKHVARLVGGWEYIGMADTQKQLPFIRKNFIELYKSQQQSIKEGMMLPSSGPVFSLVDGKRYEGGLRRLSSMVEPV